MPGLAALDACCSCPRLCNAMRDNGETGYCNTDNRFHISSICLHHGEEPTISGPNGICNIFFSRCNLQCIYCQNYQISTTGSGVQDAVLSLDEIINKVEQYLDNGCTHVGFVSPSHVILQVREIIGALHKRGRQAVFVYNSNGYDSVSTIKSLEGMIDVYLPDLKYMDTEIAEAYSGAKDYPQIASSALREMYRQKGSTLILSEDGCALSGLIIRHLVLPGHIENSKAVLKFIAQELSPLIHVSLMSQYYPIPQVEDHPNLGRLLNHTEYQQVVDEMGLLGIFRGWIQDIESHDNYRPDFDKNHPFE
ncbi:MAG: radical SAM protein [Bacteroidales bacterium]|nr:radical SAM protein [Bacteroidales bacterium]